MRCVVWLVKKIVKRDHLFFLMLSNKLNILSIIKHYEQYLQTYRTAIGNLLNYLMSFMKQTIVFKSHIRKGILSILKYGFIAVKQKFLSMENTDIFQVPKKSCKLAP